MDKPSKQKNLIISGSMEICGNGLRSLILQIEVFQTPSKIGKSYRLVEITSPCKLITINIGNLTMNKNKVSVCVMLGSLLTLSVSFPAYPQLFNNTALRLLQAGCSAHNTESEAYRCYDRGVKSALSGDSLPAIMRNMCNVTSGKAEQEVYCYRRAVNTTENQSLKNTIINVCGKNTNWGSELACIVGAVEGAR
ncbi:MAG: hypothetical protein SXA11_15805 [Cyanobacteriota bacterium]|nr:hypothetical protein [Cyanobacteriota bacterium]